MLWNVEAKISVSVICDEALRSFTVHFESPNDYIGNTKYYTSYKMAHPQILRLQFVRGLQSFFWLVDSETRINRTFCVKSRIFLHVISYVGLGCERCLRSTSIK